MRILLKKTVALWLAAVMLFLLIGTASAAVCNCENTPVIYVEGVKTLVYLHEDGTQEILLENDEGVLGDLVGALWQDALKAFVSGEWDAYCDIAYEKCKSIYAHCGPDVNGDPLPDTAIAYETGVLIPHWTYDSIPSYHGTSTTTYYFHYDWRSSPMEIADDLHAYVEAVKEKTGHEKVSIISRCIGTIPVFAYLYKYERPNDYANIEKTVFLNGCMNGMATLDALLSGNVKLDAKQLYTITKSNHLIESLPAELSEVLIPAFDSLAATKGLDGACGIINNIYANVKDKLLARILKDYYGTALCYVASVNEGYEQYKDYIFQEPGDKELYKNLIAKADAYHYGVQPEINNMINEMISLGKPVQVVCEYGFMQYPLCSACFEIGDYRVGVAQQSFGAAVSNVDTTLPADYIASRTEAGFGKYISPDKQIDASTGICPDTTWYVKNLNHCYPQCILKLCEKFIRTDDFTINSDPAYPQFLNAIAADPNNEETNYFVPAEAENVNDVDYDQKPSFFGSFAQLFTVLFAKLTDFLHGLLDFVSNLVSAVKS